MFLIIDLRGRHLNSFIFQLSKLKELADFPQVGRTGYSAKLADSLAGGTLPILIISSLVHPPYTMARWVQNGLAPSKTVWRSSEEP